MIGFADILDVRKYFMKLENLSIFIVVSSDIFGVFGMFFLGFRGVDGGLVFGFRVSVVLYVVIGKGGYRV